MSGADKDVYTVPEGSEFSDVVRVELPGGLVDESVSLLLLARRLLPNGSRLKKLCVGSRAM